MEANDLLFFGLELRLKFLKLYLVVFLGFFLLLGLLIETLKLFLALGL